LNIEENTIYHGDCLELMPFISDKSIDMIFTDLPFGLTRNHWDEVIDFQALWKQYKRIIKDNGCIALFANNPFNISLAYSNFSMYRYDWIIEYTNPRGFLNAKKMPLKCHDQLLIFYKRLPTYNPQKTTGHVRKTSKKEHKETSKKSSNYGKYNNTTYDSTERYPRSVKTFDIQELELIELHCGYNVIFKSDKQKSTLHPTQKPIDMLKYFIRTYTNENDTILDNCMGVGSMPMASIETNRKYIGIEKDLKYYKLALQRINNYYIIKRKYIKKIIKIFRNLYKRKG